MSGEDKTGAIYFDKIDYQYEQALKHNIESRINSDEKEVNAVRNEEMSGVEFLIKFCDGRFWSEDVSDEILPFEFISTWRITMI